MSDGEDNRDKGDGSGRGRQVDPGRKFGTCVGNNNNSWKCNFCFNVNNGGISRLKQHLVGGYRNAAKCKNVPEWVAKLLRDHMMQKEAQKAARNMTHKPEFGDDEYDEGEL